MEIVPLILPKRVAVMGLICFHPGFSKTAFRKVTLIKVLHTSDQ